LRSSVRDHLRFWHMLTCRLELLQQAIHVVDVIIRTLAILRLFIVSATSREPGSRRMIDSRKGAISNAIAINVLVSRKAAKLIKVFFTQTLSTIQRLGRIFKWMRHPVVHSEI